MTLMNLRVSIHLIFLCPPYIADLDSIDFKKKQLQYPVAIEGIKVTDHTSSNTSQPTIVTDVSTHVEDLRSLQSAFGNSYITLEM